MKCEKLVAKEPHENLDYQDVKLQIVQQEGYDAHDFNLFDDRSALLWRKPYVDGAVRELTSGDSRSQEQMRLMIERMMIAAGTNEPDVRHTVRKARRSRININIDAEVDDEQDLLTDIRRKPGASPPAQHILPRAREGKAASRNSPRPDAPVLIGLGACLWPCTRGAD
jgi:hypothetical protein